jgi:hypothetical protein
VFKGHRDTILGILYTRDLLGVDLAKLERDPQGIRKLLRQPNFFPESKPAVELFHTFRQRKLSFALIVDEYGGVTGLVTMEDLLECVFGEISSPSDSEVVTRHLMSDLADGRRRIDTSMSLEDFSQEFGGQHRERGGRDPRRRAAACLRRAAGERRDDRLCGSPVHRRGHRTQPHHAGARRATAGRRSSRRRLTPAESRRSRCRERSRRRRTEPPAAPLAKAPNQGGTLNA